MTSRERVLRAINHKQPDKVPFSLGATCVDGFTLYAKEQYESFKGSQHTEHVLTNFMMRSVETPFELARSIGMDFVTITLKTAFGNDVVLREDGTYHDDFGCLCSPAEYYYDVTKRPLIGEHITIQDIQNNPWADPYAPGRTQGLREEAKQLFENTDLALVTNIMCLGPFEGGCWVRGFEDFLTDFYLQPKIAEAVMDRFTEMAIGFYDVMLGAVGDYVQIVCQGDDLAMQDRAFVPLEIYNRFVLKYHKRIYDFIKSKTNAKIFHHSCGAVKELIPGLIEAGVDILEPLQTSAKGMDTDEIKREYGKDLCFWGGLDTQQIMQNATPKQVDEEVKRLVGSLGGGGGYVFSPGHNLQATVPMENVEAMIRAIERYR